MTTRKIEILVGGFIVLALAAFLMLSLKVANSGMGASSETYTLRAKFENIGGKLSNRHCCVMIVSSLQVAQKR